MSILFRRVSLVFTLIISILFVVGCNPDYSSNLHKQDVSRSVYNRLIEISSDIKQNARGEYYNGKYLRYNEATDNYVLADPKTIVISPDNDLTPVYETTQDWIDEAILHRNRFGILAKEFTEQSKLFAAEHPDIVKDASIKSFDPIYAYGVQHGMEQTPYWELGKLPLTELKTLFESTYTNPYQMMSFGPIYVHAFQGVIARISHIDWESEPAFALVYMYYMDRTDLCAFPAFRDLVTISPVELKKLVDGSIPEEERSAVLNRYGVAALPFIYSQVVELSDDRYLPYVHRVLPLWMLLREQNTGIYPSADSDPAYLNDLLQESINDVWGVLDVTNVEYIFDNSPLHDPVRMPIT